MVGSEAGSGIITKVVFRPYVIKLTGIDVNLKVLFNKKKIQKA
jgi:hypothetical protein